MRYWLIALFVIALFACSKQKNILKDGFWVFHSFQNNTNDLMEVDTFRYPRIVISFENGGKININSIVNDCAGKYKVSNGLNISELECNAMASVDSLDNMLETRFIESITNATTFHIIDSVLHIQYFIEEDIYNELVFTKDNCAC